MNRRLVHAAAAASMLPATLSSTARAQKAMPVVGYLAGQSTAAAPPLRADIAAAARTLGLETAFAEAWDDKTIDDALARADAVIE